MLALLALAIALSPGDVEAQAPEGKKAPAAALALSVLIPGAGQAYNGDWGKAALIIGGELVAAALIVSGVSCADNSNDCPNLTIGLLMAAGFTIGSWIDAPLSARKINRRIELGAATAEVGAQLRITGDRGGGLRASFNLLRVRF
jgi:hypothetical protein